ncbi:MAG: hypothetical protein J6S57_00200 [Alphaproteobacteria bacterium]|nr:hypothetical protein [Alphaproteobacteria bacterium]
MFCICGKTYSAGNEPLGDIVEATWINQDNMEKFSESVSGDLNEFQQNFETTVKSPGFVPIEVKIGLALMKAFYNISEVLQMSLVPFTKIFLLVMYAFWIAIEAYKLFRDSGDYKSVLYDVFKKGFIIIVWLMILNYGFEKIFVMIISPIISIGTMLSDFILDTTAKTYDTNIPDTCAAIHNYINAHSTGKLLIDTNAAADIMCLPGRISTYFYYATAIGFKWMLYGFVHSITAICVGAVSIYIFIKCIFKYAFMTLGVVTDLFLTILMLPFTAIAESMPATNEKGYIGKIFNGFLKLFNTKKLSDVIAKFVNAAIYFVSLSIVISICAALLEMLLSLNKDYSYSVPAAMTALLTGWLVLHLANKADELAKKLGGSIDNSFGQTLQNDSKTLLGGAKKIGSMAFKDWIKKK